MSFRLRVTLIAAAAVATAALGISILNYVLLQTELTSQFDETLVQAAAGARQFGDRPGDRPSPPFGGPASLSGRADIFAQVVSSSGAILRSDQSGGVPAIATESVRAVARGARAAFFFNITLSNLHLRAFVAPYRDGQAIEVVRQLDEIDGVLASARLRLAVVATGGILLAAALGLFVARGALRPVTELSLIVEEIARTRDLSRRVTLGGRDELGRLAAGFNVMLSALEVSITSQRQLVADASHELRTPLTSLRTNLELLARGQPADQGERRVLLLDLIGQLERLSRLVSDLIDLSRDEQSAIPVEEVRLDDLVAETIDDVAGRYPEVRFELERKPFALRGVRPRLARAVINLLDNAGKWSPPGSVVEVRVTDGEVSVRDHGPGITPEDAPHVFDRFWRAASARQMPGSGLGLAIVKDVAESHGGAVTLERPPDGGARFRLRFLPT